MNRRPTATATTAPAELVKECRNCPVTIWTTSIVEWGVPECRTRDNVRRGDGTHSWRYPA